MMEVQSRESYRNVDVNAALSREEKQTMDELLYRYSDICTRLYARTRT